MRAIGMNKPADGKDSSNLDFLRSAAVVMVLFDHLCRHYHRDVVGPFSVVNIGYFGVLLFFVHTSLVLMRSMDRSRLWGAALLKNFYVRRVFRIYPLSILAVVTAVAFRLHADGRGLAFGVRPGPGEFLSNLLLIQNLTYSDSVIGPLWSLPIELQMYLILPFLFVWRKRSAWKVLVLWLVCGFLGHLPQTVPALGWFTLLLFVPNFLPGVIAFSLPEKRWIPWYLWPVFIFLIAAVYAWDPSRRLGAGLCLLLGLLIPCFVEISLGPLRLASKWIATYSYGIYLAHSFCIWVGLTRFHSWTLFLALMLILPVGLYHAVERPGIKLGTRIADWLSEREDREAHPVLAEG
jgi:peptidoglycan/LPS O-acetylase OafA/YrhL